jgi:hypothetical protein
MYWNFQTLFFGLKQCLTGKNNVLELSNIVFSARTLFDGKKQWKKRPHRVSGAGKLFEASSDEDRPQNPGKAGQVPRKAREQRAYPRIRTSAYAGWGLPLCLSDRRP